MQSEMLLQKKKKKKKKNFNKKQDGHQIISGQGLEGGFRESTHARIKVVDHDFLGFRLT